MKNTHDCNTSVRGLLQVRRLIRITLLAALAAWGTGAAPPLWATPVSTPPRVLILAETIYNGLASYEAIAATNAIPGCAVDLVPAANWGAIPATGFSGPTGFGFDKYRAIIIGDPVCMGDGLNFGTGTANYLSALNILNATKSIWTPTVTGNVILEGVDNAFHYTAQVGAAKTLDRGVAFAVNDPNRTGMYYALSCYYDYTLPATNALLVPHLTGFGTFMVRNYPNQCFNDAHIVATHPVFTAPPALTDTELSGWFCSTHEGFDAWPPNFVVLAIALTNGTYTATDGSNGVPYILVRGEGVHVVSTIDLGPPSATNDLGTTHTVCASISTNVTPYNGVPVTFTISSGPNAVTNYTTLTDSNGVACFTYTGVGGPGVDYITASYVNSKDLTNTSPTVTKLWQATCLGVGCDALQCLGDGTWSYSFCVTNLSSAPLSTVGLLNPPTGVSFSPGTFALSPPLGPGQSTNLATSIAAPAGTTTFCFQAGAESFEGLPPCKVPHCVNLPACCNRVLTNTLTYTGTIGTTNLYNYSITVQNITANPVKFIALGADQSCVRFVPGLVDLTLPAYGGPSLLLPTQTRTVTVQVQRAAPCPGTNTFYLSMLTTDLVACCSSHLTLPKPRCIYLSSPYDGSVVLTNTRISIVALPIGPCGLTTVAFYRDTTLLGVADKAPYSLDVTFTDPGSFSLTAVAMLDTGELDTSDPAQLTVVIPGTDTDQHSGGGPTLSAGVTGSTLLLSVPTLSGHQYEVQYRTNFTLDNWRTLQSFPGDGAVKVITDPVTNDQSRFYRSVVR